MMASNASQMTTKNSTTPAINTPGTGIMASIVLGLPQVGVAVSRSGGELRVHGNFRLEQLGNRAARFRCFHGCVKLGFIRAGYMGHQVQMALGNRKSFANFFQADGASGFEFARRQSCAAKLRRKRYGEAARVCGRQKFFRICSHSIFKPRAEGILRVLERATVSGDCSLTGLQIALPNCRCFALHDVTSSSASNCSFGLNAMD